MDSATTMDITHPLTLLTSIPNCTHLTIFTTHKVCHSLIPVPRGSIESHSSYYPLVATDGPYQEAVLRAAVLTAHW